MWRLLTWACISHLLTGLHGTTFELRVNPANHVQYDGYQVFRINPQSKGDVKFLKQLHTNRNLQVEFLKPLSGANQQVDVLVSPEHSKLLSLLLENKGITVQVAVPDVQKLIDLQTNQTSQGESLSGQYFDFSKYHPYQEIVDWLFYITRLHPSVLTLIEIGRSSEGRPIYVVKVSHSREARPAVWLDAGIHSNEWIGPATLLYFINQFVTSEDEAVTQMLRHLDWYILPVFNVDGYDYTWTTDRMWRKNRSKQPGQECVGVDLNRNWDSHWGEGTGQTDPCSRNYEGPRAFSEPESDSVATFLREHNQTIRAYLAYHSFSQLWMLPYSYTAEKNPPNLPELLDMADRIVTAIESVHGTKYLYGRVSDVVGEAPGASIDYTSLNLNIPFSFGVELRDAGDYGTLLPPNQIIPNAQESMAAIKTLADLLISKLGLDSRS